MTERIDPDADLPRLVWHLGFFKVGSTYTQLLMRRNEEALAPYICAFPKHKFTIDLRRASQAFCRDANEETLSKLKSEIQRVTDKIISSGRAISVFSDETLCVFEEESQFLENLTRLLPVLHSNANGVRSEFVFYYRDIERWLRSWHNQSVKSGRAKSHFDQWRKKVDFSESWPNVFEVISASVDAPVHFFDMAEDVTTEMPVGTQLLRYSGVPDEVINSLNRPPLRNESVPDGAVDFLIEINRMNISARDKRSFRKLVIDRSDLFR